MGSHTKKEAAAEYTYQKTSYLNVNFLGFIAAHIYAVAGCFYTPFNWKYGALVVFSYYFRMWGLTAGYHRYFSHKAFKCGRVVQFVIAFIGQMTVQKGVLWWASNHRHHHKYADHGEDIHSPTLRGFLWSHMGWFLLSDDHTETRTGYIPDLMRFPELVWMDKHHTVPALMYGAFIFVVGGYDAFFWGFIVSTVILWHGTFTINSLSHVFGSVRYLTTDTSRNNWWLSIITLGEGWHNNHHTYAHAARNGFFWYEYDVTYYVLCIMEKFGLVWDLQPVPYEDLERLKIVNMPNAKELLSSQEKRLQYAEKLQKQGKLFVDTSKTQRVATAGQSERRVRRRG